MEGSSKKPKARKQKEKVIEVKSPQEAKLKKQKKEGDIWVGT